MRTPEELLDAPAVPRSEEWFAEVEHSLGDDLDAWLPLELTRDRAWRLLNVAEEAATQVVRDRDPVHVERAAVALSLLEDGPLDRREAMLVGAVLHRGAELADMGWDAPVRAGCARVGERGRRCREWLSRAHGSIERTHVELGAGPTFRFDRADLGIDIPALERWARGED